MNPYHLFGKNVIINKPTPKIQVSENILISDSCRNKMNNYLIKMFGYHDFDDNIIYSTPSNYIMSEKMYQQILSHCSLN